MQLASTATLTRGLSPPDAARLRKVLRYCDTHLSSVIRHGRETYAQHCRKVAGVVAELHSDCSLLCAALLHDLPMHPDGARLLRASPLTAEERQLVRGMQRLRKRQIDAKTDDLDLVIQSFMRAPGLLLLRMAHRVNDVRVLSGFRPALRRPLAEETLHMYAAIAGRIGLHRWRSEMEDRCFLALQPRIAGQIRNAYQRRRRTDDVCLELSQRFLRRALRERGIQAMVDSRRKGLYSTYRKMAIKQRPFDKLTDRLAVRIIVTDIDTCYRALGVVHATMHPIPGKLKDYIGAPKENGYRSIHTVVFPLPGISDQPIEIQIRTADMHRECEFGIASHGRYKAMAYKLGEREAHVNLLRNLAMLRTEAKTPAEFGDALRTYFRGDQLLLFNPHGTIAHLPKGATALDFAYSIAGDRAARLREVRINGRVRMPDTPLADGDTVDIRCGRTPAAMPKWLHACALPATRRAVARWLEQR